MNFVQEPREERAAFSLNILKANRPNLISGSFPDTLISISSFSSCSSEQWDPQTHNITTSSYSEFVPEPKRIPIHGVVGSLVIGNQLWLSVIEQVELVGHILNHKIFTPKKVNFVPLSNLRSSQINKTFTKISLEEHKKLIEEGGFFFSYTYPLWNHFQGYGLKDENILRKERYIWNSHLNGMTSSPYMINLIRGHFQTIKYHNDISMTLISRIDKRNAGTRYTTRGLNQDAAPAITVESEVILSSITNVVSYIQVRGSLPLVWKQSLQKNGSTRIEVEKCQKVKLVDRHLKDLNNIISGKHTMLNLLGRNDQEKKFSGEFENILKESKSGIDYLNFPLKWGSKSLFTLIDLISETKNLDFFSASLNSYYEVQKVIQTQKELIRTNCLDCIDRTSIAQFGILSKILPTLLKAILPPHEELKTIFSYESDLFSKLCHGWADMANTIALYYTGTGIINETLIRDEFKNLPFSDNDILICKIRHTQNRIYDFSKKIILDQFLNQSLDSSPIILPKQYSRHCIKWSTKFNQLALSFHVTSHLLESVNNDTLNNIQTIVQHQLSNMEALQKYCLIHNIDIELILKSFIHIPYIISCL